MGAGRCGGRGVPVPPATELTWEMASLKEDLNSWMSAVSRFTSCPVRLASKNATSCLPGSGAGLGTTTPVPTPSPQPPGYFTGAGW